MGIRSRVASVADAVIKRRMPRLLLVAALVLLLACVLLAVLSGPIVNTIYGNIRGEPDREVPPSIGMVLPTSTHEFLLGGRGEGLNCSISGLLSPIFGFEPVADQFRQACASHDMCYRHGATTYNYTQQDCDRLLQEDAFRLCRAINKQETVRNCQTQARKVLLGVRLGGFGSFRSKLDEAACPTIEPAQRSTQCVVPDLGPLSTYFEYENLPRSHAGYVVARVAPIPQALRSADYLPQGIYYFVVEPAGIDVNLYLVSKDGGIRTDPIPYKVYGSTNFMTAPPSVVKGRFFWWRRAQWSNTSGNAVYLDPAVDTKKKWKHILRDISGPCPDCDAESPILQEAPGPSGSELLGLSLHVCKGSRTEACLARQKDSRINHFPLSLRKEVDSHDADRYRSFVSLPTVMHWLNGARMLFSRRDAWNDPDYEGSFSLIEVDPSMLPVEGIQITPLVHRYGQLSTSQEPFAILPGSPELLTITKNPSNPSAPIGIRLHSPGVEPKELSCGSLDGAWLDIPPLVTGTDFRTLIFRRLMLTGTAKKLGRADFWLAKYRLTTQGTCEEIAKVRLDLIKIVAEYAGKQSDMIKVADLLLGQSILADLDEDQRMDFVITRRENAIRTRVWLNIFNEPAMEQAPSATVFYHTVH